MTATPYVARQPDERGFIHYSETEHAVWRTLIERQLALLEGRACPEYLDGIQRLGLPRERIPQLDEINRVLASATGWQVARVPALIPFQTFFELLAKRRFPVATFIRRPEELDYLQEPDIFHDIAGHVPMHTDKAFADTLVRFGDCAHTAAELVASVKDEDLRIRRLTSIFKGMARFFWFTVEFGLMRGQDGLKAYGSGLLSSYGELAHSIESPEVQRYPIQMEWVVNQYFEIDKYQPLLFVVDSFDHLFDLVGQLERWMRAGRLDNLAPGEPVMSEPDVRSFLEAALRTA